MLGMRYYWVGTGYWMGIPVKLIGTPIKNEWTLNKEAF